MLAKSIILIYQMTEVYKMIVLVNFMMSTKFGWITNSGIQCKLHIIKYLTMQD